MVSAANAAVVNERREIAKRRFSTIVSNRACEGFISSRTE
jgi:hypothetical protein